MDRAGERLTEAMEAYFGDDRRRVAHASEVAKHAERIMESEGGDPDIIIAAALLHDIGIHEAERKYGSTSGKYQEVEGPSIARPILEEHGFPPDQIEEVCEIIAHHHSPGRINTTNFRVLYDADWLVNLRDEYNVNDRNKLSAIIDRVFLTEGGKRLAREMYLR